ncbi:MAG: hypothetical protein ACPG6U_14150, partial [Paracoccaceae bacterium]
LAGLEPSALPRSGRGCILIISYFNASLQYHHPSGCLKSVDGKLREEYGVLREVRWRRKF